MRSTIRTPLAAPAARGTTGAPRRCALANSPARPDSVRRLAGPVPRRAAGYRHDGCVPQPAIAAYGRGRGARPGCSDTLLSRTWYAAPQPRQEAPAGWSYGSFFFVLVRAA